MTAKLQSQTHFPELMLSNLRTVVQFNQNYAALKKRSMRNAASSSCQTHLELRIQRYAENVCIFTSLAWLCTDRLRQLDTVGSGRVDQDHVQRVKHKVRASNSEQSSIDRGSDCLQTFLARTHSRRRVKPLHNVRPSETDEDGVCVSETVWSDNGVQFV